jgi:tRNA threonylcarbamoyladenosine biosynthesis protein TsaB
MKKNGITARDISCVAASVGPGSFTGIRIGVSSARAFAQAMNIPCLSVPTLQSFLYNIENDKGLVCPIFDARRSQIYGGAFYFNEGSDDINEAVPGGAYDIEQYLTLLGAGITQRKALPVTFFGDGSKVYREKIEQWQNTSLNDNIRLAFAAEGKREQSAASVARLALKFYKEGKQIHYKELTPVYMRKAEAERKLEAGLLSLKR